VWLGWGPVKTVCLTKNKLFFFIIRCVVMESEINFKSTQFRCMVHYFKLTDKKNVYMQYYI
jgi:hypothetical protein